MRLGSKLQDFVVEILSPCTEKYDRNEKMTDYAAHGIPEYWIIDPKKKTIEQYLNKGKKYELSQKIKSGTIQSEVIEGFEIDVLELF